MHQNTISPERVNVNKSKPSRLLFRLRLAFPAVIILSFILACRFLQPPSPADSVVVMTRLPTLTPTAAAMVDSGEAMLPSTAPAATPADRQAPSTTPPAATEAGSPSVNSGNTPPPDVTDTPPTSTAVPTTVATPVNVAEISGWSFAGVQIQPDPDQNSLQVYGNVINNTGSPQELMQIRGAILDEQGQLLADENSSYGYWPVVIIPPGGQAPFIVTTEGTQQADDVNLSVEAESSSAAPRQDFVLSDLSEQNDGLLYCVQGTLQNPGEALQEYLLIVATLYDSQDTVINFSEYFADPEYVIGDQTEAFEICVETRQQEVARHELKVWGR